MIMDHCRKRSSTRIQGVPDETIASGHAGETISGRRVPQIYSDRITDCNSDHRDSRGPAAARPEPGAGESAKRQLRQQSQAMFTGDGLLCLGQQRLLIQLRRPGLYLLGQFFRSKNRLQLYFIEYDGNRRNKAILVKISFMPLCHRSDN